MPPWQHVAPDAQQKILELATQYATAPVPPLPATLYLEFRRDGNRSHYQDAMFQRRSMLNALALAECVEGKGRFLDPLANVIWSICEESAWTLPAHVGVQQAGVGLPDTDEPIVALFSAETACSLAWVMYLLHDELDQVSPQICLRARREIDRRILTPYLARDDFRWMGFHSGGRPNNWNPWINSNVLAITLLLEQDPERRQALVQKVLRSVDRFFVPYPADGSCDEGPSYWGRAGASLFENLDLLYSATGEKFSVFDDPVVQEIGRYICRLHIARNTFVCVGDCDAIADVPRDLVYRFGQRIDDQPMQALAQAGQIGEELWGDRRGPWSMMRVLHTLFDLPNLRSKQTAAPLLRDVWLADPDMQLMAARDAAGSEQGLYVAAWGGHNGQSHNHNDVGNFVVYQHGFPALIDAGRPTYTRQTFSSDRYKIWSMQSDYHNLPRINGQMQGVGSPFAATDVTYQADDSVAVLHMNLAAAYPKQAGIRQWQRSVRLVRGKSVQVVDSFALQQPSDQIVQHLMTPCRVELLGAGQLRLLDQQHGTDLLVRYDPSLQVQVETIELDDPLLQIAWGKRLFRIIMQATKRTAESTWLLEVSPWIAKKELPNVVLILADDLGYGDLSCQGATKIQTPHIDRLAREGRRFTDAHSPCSVCTPTRYNLMTGRYAWRTWAKSSCVWANDPLLIDPNRFTLADLFSQNGYTTACIGKWHLGFGQPGMPGWDDVLGPDYNRPLRPGPLECGFDYFYGIPHVGQLPHVIIENHQVLGLTPDDPISITPDPRPGYEQDYLHRPRNAFTARLGMRRRKLLAISTKNWP